MKITMKKGKKSLVIITVLVLALCIGIGAFVLPRFLQEAEPPIAGTPALPGTGLWVTKGDLFTGGTAENPLKEKDLHAEADALLDYLVQNRIAECYWEIELSEDYENTLGYFCKKAAKNDITVYAVLPAFENTEFLLQKTEELKNLVQTVEAAAEVDGFILQEGIAPQADASTASDTVSPLLSAIRTVAGASEKTVGLVYSGSGSLDGTGLLTLADLETLIGDGTINLLLPQLSGTADAAYGQLTESWKQLAPATIRPLAAEGFSEKEVSYQLFYNTTSGAPGAAVLTGYQRLAAEPALLQMLLSFADAKTVDVTGAVDLSCEQSLQIGYPDSGISTYYSTIYIMGTSDPERSLTMNGATVKREGSEGCFGVEVRLSLGSNTFTFRQGEESKTVTIRRLSASGDDTITRVTAASRFPTANAAVLAGNELTFRCVAPSGGIVTAKINGTTVTMEQKAATAKKGVAATYEGTYQVPADLAAGELTNLGKVTYTLTYAGSTSTYESEGKLYAAGTDVTPLVLASTENVSIIADYTDDSTILETLHYGARIATTGCVQYNGTIFFAVQGGYISAARSELVTEIFPGASTVTEISSKTEGRDTTITLATGNFPAVTGSSSGGVLRIFFRDTVLPKDLSGIECELISVVQSNATLGGTQLLITLTDAQKLWGFDIQYSENGDVLLLLKESPTLSSTPGKPLQGITVMVDAGHGNYDCGALGVAGGKAGPTESELNLAIGLALQQRLEQLGATVLMTRVSDDLAEEKIVLDERVSMAVDAKPDFFLSIHHNSTALVKDVTANWMEAYYYEELSLPFAENLRANMMEATGRKCNDPEWGYYYVTRLSFCPAVLFEVGYIPNPVQYEDCMNWLSVYRTASAMAQAIVESVPEAPAAQP